MIAHLAVVLVPLLVSLPAVRVDALAPDGRPGLGAESSLTVLLGVFRSPNEEEEALLRHLIELESRLAVLEAGARALYQARGYFAVLGRRDEPSLERLHEVLRAFLQDPGAHLEQGDAARRAWAELFLDARLRVRRDVLDGWREDADTVTKGLAALRANTDGWTRLREDEAQNVAARVDLAAARLRARLRDLEALREDAPSGAPAPLPPELPAGEDAVERLLAAGALPPGAERVARLAQEEQRMRATVAGMETVLFTTRLAGEALTWLQWRELHDGHAATKRAEVRVWQPQTAEGKEAPPEIGRIKKTTRRREAYRRALEGLAYDPLDAELAYAAALMSRYVGGTLETLSHYDRFLALRGIRVHEHRTWQERELTDEEEDALFFIQQYEQENPPGGVPPPGSE